MSINSSNFFLIENVLNLFPNLSKINMLELGNQMILKENSLKVKAIVAKAFFQEKGIHHTSFDINEKDGAIKINLSKPIKESYFNKFDIVTNFGTTEHIENQNQVFQNIHNCCKVGGYIIHSLPEDGFWKGHSPYHYNSEFPLYISKDNNYKLFHLSFDARRKERLINFILQKIDNTKFKFTNKGIIFSKDYKRNTDNIF